MGSFARNKHLFDSHGNLLILWWMLEDNLDQILHELTEQNHDSLTQLIITWEIPNILTLLYSICYQHECRVSYSNLWGTARMIGATGRYSASQRQYRSQHRLQKRVTIKELPFSESTLPCALTSILHSNLYRGEHTSKASIVKRFAKTYWQVCLQGIS